MSAKGIRNRAIFGSGQLVDMVGRCLLLPSCLPPPDLLMLWWLPI